MSLISLNRCRGSACILPWVPLVVVLTACGGGGGSSAPLVVVPDGPRAVAASADSDVTVVNFGVLGAPLVRAVLGGSDSGLLDPIGGADAQPQAATAVARVQAPTLTGRTMLAWMTRVGRADRKRIAAVTTENLPCEFGGQLTVSFDDADNDNLPSAGDSIGFSAQDCVDDPGLPAANGGFTMRINAVELDAQGEPTALDVSGSFNAFTLAGYGSVDGGFQLWTRQETAASTRLRVSYRAASVTEASGTVLYDFDIDGLENAAGGSFEISGGLGIAGRTYALSTPVRMQYAAGQAPAVGTVDLRDAAGDKLQLVARSAVNFDLGFAPAGSELWTEALIGLAWADYED
jgi:hypothetical protein